VKILKGREVEVLWDGVEGRGNRRQEAALLNDRWVWGFITWYLSVTFYLVP
jgi:hypothetical protein